MVKRYGRITAVNGLDLAVNGLDLDVPAACGRRQVTEVSSSVLDFFRVTVGVALSVGRTPSPKHQLGEEPPEEW